MGNFNIVSNQQYKWTLVNGSYVTDEAPRIYAKTFKVDQNAIIGAVKSWVEITGSNSGTGYYDNMHQAKLQDTWVFPYFNDDVRSFTNEWGDSYVGSTNGSQIAGGEFAGNVKDLASNILATVGQANALLSNKPGALFEPPKFYQYSANDSAVSLEFTLINTDGPSDYQSNYSLVKKLITENRMTRDSGFIATPPVLWSVTIPGYRAIRWASCNVDVSLIGKRVYKGNNIIPEGYRVRLTFNSLYTEPSNFGANFSDTSSLGG